MMTTTLRTNNNRTQLNDEELLQVVGSGAGSDVQVWGGFGKVFAHYIEATRAVMPTNKQMNIACIYQDRINAMARGDAATVATDNAKLKFLGVDVDLLDQYAREAGMF